MASLFLPAQVTAALALTISLLKPIEWVTMMYDAPY